MKQGVALQGAWVADQSDRLGLETDPRRVVVAEIVGGASELFDWEAGSSPEQTAEEFVERTITGLSEAAVEWIRDGETSKWCPPVTRRQLRYAEVFGSGPNPDKSLKRLHKSIRFGSCRSKEKLGDMVSNDVYQGMRNGVLEASWTLVALYGVACARAAETELSPLDLTMNSFRLIVELARLNKHSDPAVLKALSTGRLETEADFRQLSFDPSRFVLSDTPRGPGLVAKLNLLEDDRYKETTPGCPMQQNRGIFVFTSYLLNNYARLKEQAA